MNQTLSFIGNGAAFYPKYGNNSAYFKIQSNLILIDCGENIFERIIKKNILKDINYVFILITHLHSDHIGSLSSLLYYLYYIKKIKANVFFTNSIGALAESGNMDQIDYNMNLMKANVSQIINLIMDDNSISPLIIIPIKVSHTNKLRTCLGYIIDTNNIDNKYYDNHIIIWYSGDTNEISQRGLSYHPDEIYHDTCINDFSDNPHCYYKKLYEYFNRYKGCEDAFRKKVFCMHLDGGFSFKRKLKSLGFNIAKIK